MHFVIIGAGPGGYEAAIKAAQNGAKVTLIEKESVGGTCLNNGCIPTKTLLHAAKLIETMGNSSEYGISFDNMTFDFKGLIKKKKSVVKNLGNGIKFLLDKNKINIIYGVATFIDKTRVSVKSVDGQEQIVTGDKFIIATGSESTKLPIDGIDLPQVLNSTDVLNLDKLPESIAIIGGGVIGVEFATILSSMGTKVSIFETLPSLIANVDHDISSMLELDLKGKGIDIYTNSSVTQLGEGKKNRVNIIFDQDGQEHELAAEYVLVSVGRKANTEELNLDNIGVSLENSFIKVNDNLETDVKNIYAIGDVRLGNKGLAHAASFEGKKVVEHALGKDIQIKDNIIPSCIFTYPEIGTVGLTEKEAKELGYDVKVGTFNYSSNGKALSMDINLGMVKVVSERKYGAILGVHIIGENASDIIHEATLAIYGEFDTESLGEMIHAHPTLSETLMEATLDSDGIAIHNPPR